MYVCVYVCVCVCLCVCVRTYVLMCLRMFVRACVGASRVFRVFACACGSGRREGRVDLPGFCGSLV